MTPTEQTTYNTLRTESWNNALHSFGSNYIFAKKIVFYSRLNKVLKFSGIVIPVIIGATAATYGYNAEVLKYAIIILAPLGIIQLFLSLWAIIWDWDNELAYAFEASQHYNFLSNEFKKSGNTPPTTLSELQNRHDLLMVEYNHRAQQDLKHSFTPKENREGMRAGLRQFQRQCVGCNQTPLSMESTSCNVCGNF